MNYFIRSILFTIIILLWDDLPTARGEQIDYSLSLILTFPRKIFTVHKINHEKDKPEKVEQLSFEYLQKRFFLTNIEETVVNIRSVIDKTLKNPALTGLTTGNVEITVVGTDEFRYLYKANRAAYNLALDAVKDTVKSYKIFANNVKVIIVNSNDEAWSYYSEGLRRKIIPEDQSLISLNRYQLMFVLKPSSPLLEMVDPNSNRASDDGFDNYYSILIDCAGPEYMEIKSNNFFSRRAKENKIPEGTEIPFPCYPKGTRYFHSLTLRGKDYEYCDHQTYESFKPLDYTYRGEYNQSECTKLIDEIVKTKFGCKNIPMCSLSDIPRDFLDFTKHKILLNMDPGIGLTLDGSPITQSWLDSEIKKACYPRTNDVPETEFEKCFYVNYLNYMYGYLELSNRNFDVSGNRIDWYRYFTHGPGNKIKPYVPPPIMPSTTSSPASTKPTPKPTPKTTPPSVKTPAPSDKTPPPLVTLSSTTTSPTYTSATKTPGKATISSKSKLLAIVFGVIGGLILLAIIILLLIMYFTNHSKSYDEVGTNENA